MPSHLTLEERDRLAHLRLRGHNQKEIAGLLQRGRSTISRELRRNRTAGEYYAAQAHRESERRRRERPLVRKMDRPAINENVRAGLAQDWAPEQIAGRAKQQSPEQPDLRVSPQTIYAWIKRDKHRTYWESHLRRRGKRPCRRKPAVPNAAARIKNRPEVIEERLRFGDFEGDTVLGSPGTGGIVTLVDRKSRFTIITKIQTKDADHVHGRIKLRLIELDKEHRRSITFDNGTEFARCRRLEKHLNMMLYFADPHLSASARHERKHQRPDPPILSQRNRLSQHHPSRGAAG
jgi:IS30 family transposase